MTMLDLGPERPGHASETREWADGGRAATETPRVSNRSFVIALAVILVALVVFALLR